MITKSKELCSTIMEITDKSPKKFKFTLTSKMQNLAIDIIENTYRANGISYLGWHFYLTDTEKVVKKLLQSGKKRIKKRIMKQVNGLLNIYESVWHLLPGT